MNNTRLLAIANGLAFGAVIVVNALANALPINGLNTGEVSALYPSLFTPAGVTFSIWSVIYLLLLGFTLYQWRLVQRPDYALLSKLFIASCLLNMSWIFAWHYLFTLASVVIMLLFLLVLTKIFLLLQKTAPASKVDYALLHLPFTLYFAWICVATIANISAWLVSLGWNGGALSPTTWAIVMMVIASLLGAYILWRFRAFAYPVVTLWALYGISLRHQPMVAQAAVALLVALAVMVVAFVFKKSSSVSTR